MYRAKAQGRDTFRLYAPAMNAKALEQLALENGLRKAIANGELRSNRTRGGSTTWVWDAREPMASYLTTATIGQFDVHAYRADGIRYWDAIDPDLFAGATPRTGERFIHSPL